MKTVAYTLLLTIATYCASAQNLDEARSLNQKGVQERQSGHWRPSFDAFYQASLKAPSDKEIQTNLGLAAEKIRQSDVARVAFLKVQEIDKNDTTSIIHLTTLFFNTHRYDDAIVFGKRMQELKVGTRANYYIGKSYYEKESFGSAFRYLEAAAKEFAARGFEGASLNAILEAAGFGKSSYYYYFEDKEDLFATVFQTRLKDVERNMPPFKLNLKSKQAFWGGFQTYLAGYLKTFEQEPITWELARALQVMRRSPSARLKPLFEQSRALYVASIQQGQQAGYVRADLDAGLLASLLEAVDAVVDEQFLKNRTSTEQHAALVTDLFKRLLEPPKGKKP